MGCQGPPQQGPLILGMAGSLSWPDTKWGIPTALYQLAEMVQADQDRSRSEDTNKSHKPGAKLPACLLLLHCYAASEP